MNFLVKIQPIYNTSIKSIDDPINAISFRLSKSPIIYHVCICGCMCVYSLSLVRVFTLFFFSYRHAFKL